MNGIFKKFKASRQLKKEEDKVFETLEEIIDEREERGDAHLIDARELPMLKNLFRLRDIRAKDVMTPRVDIAAVHSKMRITELARHLKNEKFSRYPVYDGALDNVVGVLYVKDVLFALLEKKKIKITELMKKDVLFIAPSMRALDLLKVMQRRQIQLAVVVDEHGGVDGLVSLEDLLEVIVGKIDDEHDEPEAEMIVQVNATTLEVNAKIKLEELEKQTGIHLDNQAENDIDTLGGFIVHLAGRVPSKFEVIHDQTTGIRFIVLSSNPSHIEKVKLTNLPVPKKDEKE